MAMSNFVLKGLFRRAQRPRLSYEQSSTGRKLFCWLESQTEVLLTPGDTKSRGTHDIFRIMLSPQITALILAVFPLRVDQSKSPYCTPSAAGCAPPGLGIIHSRRRGYRLLSNGGISRLMYFRDRAMLGQPAHQSGRTSWLIRNRQLCLTGLREGVV